jgi:hypothetical protein
MNKTAKSSLVLVLMLVFLAPLSVGADDVTDWNPTMLRAGPVAGTSPIVMTRVAAIVQAAVFDAVNGIDGRYTPVHVAPAAPSGASRRAAVVQAAYATLIQLYPPQKSTLETRVASPWQPFRATHVKAARQSPVESRGARPLLTGSWHGVAPMDSPKLRLRSWVGMPSDSGGLRHPRRRQEPFPSSPT